MGFRPRHYSRKMRRSCWAPSSRTVTQLSMYLLTSSRRTPSYFIVAELLKLCTHIGPHSNITIYCLIIPVLPQQEWTNLYAVSPSLKIPLRSPSCWKSRIR
uniref:Uncharacterized protein n=1 Tax=Cacopsylla melanoneura TaxID=428564 RepID=A0A8D9FJZ8_9HEMI